MGLSFFDAKCHDLNNEDKQLLISEYYCFSYRFRFSSYLLWYHGKLLQTVLLKHVARL